MVREYLPGVESRIWKSEFMIVKFCQQKVLSEINEKIKAEIQEQHVQLQLKYAIEIVKILRLSSFLSFFLLHK